jgi:hypothetical protein
MKTPFYNDRKVSEVLRRIKHESFESIMSEVDSGALDRDMAIECMQGSPTWYLGIGEGIGKVATRQLQK